MGSFSQKFGPQTHERMKTRTGTEHFYFWIMASFGQFRPKLHWKSWGGNSLSVPIPRHILPQSTWALIKNDNLSKKLPFCRIQKKNRKGKKYMWAVDRLSTLLLPTSNDEEITQPSSRALLDPALLCLGSVCSGLSGWAGEGWVTSSRSRISGPEQLQYLKHLGLKTPWG